MQVSHPQLAALRTSIDNDNCLEFALILSNLSSEVSLVESVRTFDGYSAVHYVIKEDRPSLLSILLSRGEVSAHRKTWLSHACFTDSLGCVEWLLDNTDMSPNDVLSENGYTPLHHAIYGKATKCIDLLLQRKAKVNCPMPSARTPLHIACGMRLLEVISKLLNHGADINAMDKKGKRPIHMVTKRSDKVMLDMLLMYGADINAGDADLCTPLHSACQNGCITVVEWLLAHGADVNARNAEGKTALDVSITIDTRKAVLQYHGRGMAHVRKRVEVGGIHLGRV